MSHNAEIDACDLLYELQEIESIIPLVDKDSYQRVCLYLQSTLPYILSTEQPTVVDLLITLYKKFGTETEAMIMSLRHKTPNDQLYKNCTNKNIRRQMAFILARAQFPLTGENDPELIELLSNTRLSKYFLSLARELDIMEPKTTEDIYKTHLETTRSTYGGTVDSARQNLAATFVNAFVNAGFGKDKLMTEDGTAWIYKNKEHGMMSAAASLGMILLWDVDAVTTIDKFLYSSDEYVKAGALLGVGIISSSVRNEYDPALYLLLEFVESKSTTIKIGSMIGLGLAYAGTGRANIGELLLPVLGDSSASIEVVSMAALALGYVFVGTGNGDIASSILQTMMERDERQLREPHARFLGLALGLLYLQKEAESEPALEGVTALPGSFGKEAWLLLHSCAYACTGRVQTAQEMVHTCEDHNDDALEKKDTPPDMQGAFAAIGLALVAMGEEYGAQMSVRIYNQLMHYGDAVIRRAVPLALGLLCVSNPQQQSVIDMLSRYSHDADPEVAASAIFALGLVGAGTNNARLALMLRQLASFYHKEPTSLFTVRIAQGLLHMGKGTLSVTPFFAQRFLVSKTALAGLLTVLIGMTDSKNRSFASCLLRVFVNRGYSYSGEVSLSVVFVMFGNVSPHVDDV